MWLKFSPALALNKIEHFSNVSILLNFVNIVVASSSSYTNLRWIAILHGFQFQQYCHYQKQQYGQRSLSSRNDGQL